MFRLLKLRPPHGWNAVAWELAVVTAGVLIALGTQQWVDDQSLRSKANSVTAALREETADHYRWAVEWRTIEPCVRVQIDRLQERLLKSGERLDPAPIYSEPGFDFYILRMPNRSYDRSVWQAAVSDGITPYLNRSVRLNLNSHYSRLDSLIEFTTMNNIDYPRLFSLSRPLPLDPATRFSFLQTLDELRGRVEMMSLFSGQSIDHLQKAGMIPPPAVAQQTVRQSGTVHFCRNQRLQVRLIDEAMKPIPN